jgi:hypothetical protein
MKRLLFPVLVAGVVGVVVKFVLPDLARYLKLRSM